MKIKYANLDFTPKDINEERKSLRAVFSTSDIDRHGEVVDQKSWILNDYLKNPVVLFSHDHTQPPVGKIVGLGYNGDGNLEGEIQFAADEYPFANILWKLYKGGYMKAFSVGFSPDKIDVVDEQVILKDNTLYEISTVSVPANAMALAKSKGLDVTALEDKYVEIAGDVKEAIKVETEETVEEKEEECEEPKEVVEPVTPVEETTEETPAEAPVEEEKAIDEKADSISEVVDEQEERKMKWEKFNELDKLFWAFYEVYFDSETKADEYDTLLKEYISLLGGTDTKSKLLDVDASEVEQKQFAFLMEKAGRVLSKKNRTAVEDAVDALQKVLDADKPVEEDEKEAVPEEEKAALSTEVSIPVIETATVAKANKGLSKRKINKAIRQLLKAKKVSK